MTDAHARPSSAAPAPLYDENVATPTHAERARTLVTQQKTGTLCTLAAEPAGYPYGSFVTVALNQGHPVFLISEMAEHTKNLRGDTRASLLVAEGGADDPLANGRVTLLGHCRPLSAPCPEAREAFLSVHPNASYYADFKDFNFWQLTVESVRYIGGYGRMSWVQTEDFLAAEPDPLASAAAGIISHMNADHADALIAYCHAFSRATETERVVMTSVDRYGFEMSVETSEGPRPVRLAFPEPISTSTEARKALVAMLEQARKQLATHR